MDLVFDIGNTETVVGLFTEGELRSHWRLASEPRRTVDEYGILLRQLVVLAGVEPRDIRYATVASVVPSLTQVLSGACSRYLSLDLDIIDATTPLPIRLQVEEPLTVGADRIVNTLAARRLFAVDTIVVDLGTATTYDCITHDGHFLGGVIAPGVTTAAERLTDRTAKLPRVEVAQPGSVIGRRTETCLQSGVFYSAVDAIDGIVKRIQVEWDRPDALVVATGGLSPMIGPACSTVQRIEPFLTLHGVLFAREARTG
ncbi:MAG TPA: type III pantothenate kinase [Longimicrobiaceae bacterium]|nr:type III pantothenate kinase [Longimicrobiaceae bacterium]